MKTIHFVRNALSVFVAAILLVGCGGSLQPIGGSSAMRQGATEHRSTTSSAYHLVYSFHGNIDGEYPQAGLINVNGAMYGTTSGSARISDYDKGSVFRVATDGNEKTLHIFKIFHYDGQYPLAGLVKVNGTLYGTTGGGGTNDNGTIFSITPYGLEKVLYRFAGGSDGAIPFAGLINVNGTLYGTTTYGGMNNYGTVFSITTSGTEKVLYRFAGGSDGAAPYASLINVNGTLYGTTSAGGVGSCKDGCGTLFSVTTTGTEKVLYRFAGGDGAAPRAGLTNVNGTLYGTTTGGGANGDGIVFSVTTTGTEKQVHVFGAADDGADPYASLIDVHGILYGTTVYGGAYNSGTVFSVTPSGTERVLHSFGLYPDGAIPMASLLDIKGTLYGTTFRGGGYCNVIGCGAVFALTP